MIGKNHVAGKSIIVTGAAGGFGRLIAQRAAALGAKLTCADVDRDALQETVAGIAASGGVAQAVPADVTRIDEMRAVAQQRDVPLFDRFAIMRYWSDEGAFDFYAAGRDIGLAQRVHDCLGRAIGTLVIRIVQSHKARRSALGSLP